MCHLSGPVQLLRDSFSKAIKQRQLHSLTGNGSRSISSESEHAGAALTAAHPSSPALVSLPHTLVFPSAAAITTREFSVKSYLDFFTLFLHLLCIFDNEDVAFVHFVVSSVPQPVLISLGRQIQATQTRNKVSKLMEQDEWGRRERGRLKKMNKLSSPQTSFMPDKTSTRVAQTESIYFKNFICIFDRFRTD